MKPEKLYELLGSINENLISRAGNARKNKRKANIIRAISAVACLTLVVTAVSVYVKNRPIDDETGYLDPEKSVGITDGADGSTDKGSAPNNNATPPQDNNNSLPPDNSSAGSSEQQTNPPDPSKEPTAPTQPQTVYPVVSPIAKILGAAVYPTMPKVPQESDYTNYSAYSSAYNSWRAGQSAISALETDKTGNSNFTKKTATAILKNLDGKNRVYSPASLYISLSMLAETTGGNTQKEILSALGKKGNYDLRTNVSNLWQKLYDDNGIFKSVIANSLWLRDGIEYKKETIETLQNKYFASSFAGDFNSQEYAQAMRNWLNEQTGGMLEDEVQKLSFNDTLQTETAAVFASTLYFNAKWDNKFDKKHTKPATFHSPKGDATVNFMNDISIQNYIRTDKFSATECEFEYGGKMTFILPNEDKTVDDILGDTDVTKLLTASANNMKKHRVTLSVPKFDMTCNVDLKDCLNTIGISAAFDPSADFSPLTDAYENIWLGNANQTTRIRIDEEGCEASTYTLMTMIGDSAPQYEQVDFTLDRPFIFVVSGVDNLPRFIGVVNQP